MKTRKPIHIGTSGWAYDHWKGAFYPEDTSSRDYFLHYAQRFQTVEINRSFYRMPGKKALEHWREQAPEGFVFAVKASRYITHMKKLKDPQEPVERFLNPIESLQEHLGPVLFQLPPHWGCNAERLEAFLEVLPGRFRYAFEFRDPSWFSPSIYELLRSHKAAFCIYDLEGRLSPKEITSDFVYVRLHGPQKQAYRGRYSASELSGWAGAFTAWTQQGREIFCYFDNDEAGYAPRNALKLQAMVCGG